MTFVNDIYISRDTIKDITNRYWDIGITGTNVWKNYNHIGSTVSPNVEESIKCAKNIRYINRKNRLKLLL